MSKTAARLPNGSRDLYSVQEFLDRNSLTVDDVFALAAEDRLPRSTIINGRRLISRSAAWEWLILREMAA